MDKHLEKLDEAEATEPMNTLVEPAQHAEVVQRRVMELMGDAYFRAGKFKEGQETYEKAGLQATRDQLLACADACVEHADCDTAIRIYSEQGAIAKLLEYGKALEKQRWREKAVLAYRLAGAKDAILSCGKRAIQEGGLDDAKKIFEELEEPMPKEMLAARGNKWLMDGNLHAGRIAYKMAGIDIPREMLIACGEVCSQKKDLSNAVEAFAAAGGADKELTVLGKMCMTKDTESGSHSTDSPYKAFRAAGNKEELLACGDWYAANDRISLALQCYEEGGASKEKFLECGKRALEKEWVDVAAKAYELAGEKIPVKTLIEIGDRHLHTFERHPQLALDVYKIVANMELKDADQQ